MPEFLKGNYKVNATIEDNSDAADSTDEFERKALSRLGGSICFVSKKSLIWRGEAQPQASRATPEKGDAQPAGGAAPAGEATTRTASRATPENGDEKGKADGAGTKDSRRA